MRSTKVLNAIIFGSSMSIAFICVVGLSRTDLLHESFFASSQTNKSQKMGRIVSVKKHIRGKNRGRLTWKSLSQNQLVHDGDTIYVGKGAMATIELNQGQTIQLTENTLIEIRTRKQQVSLNLKLGSLSGDLKNNSSLELIDSLGNRQILSGVGDTSFSIEKLSSNNLKIKGSSNNLQVSSFVNGRSKAFSFAPKSFSEEDQNRLKDQFRPLQLQKPTALVPSSEKLVVPKTPFHFSWTAVYGSQSYEVEVDKDDTFKNPIVNSRNLNRPFLRVRGLDEGLYYWRARAQLENLKKGLWSAPTAFYVGMSPPKDPIQLAKLAPNPPKAPIIAKDFMKRSLKFTQTEFDRYRISRNTQQSPRFTWSEDGFVEKYNLEIARDKKFEQLIRTVEVSQNLASWVSFEEGNFYWRVSATGYNKKTSQFSKVGNLEIKVLKTIKTKPQVKKAPVQLPGNGPRSVSPKDGTTIISVGGKQENILLLWDSLSTASSYEVEISPDKSFKESYGKYITRKPAFVIEDTLLNGKNYWRVRAKSKKGKTDWSTPKHFIIQDFYKSDDKPFRPTEY